jgi:hypothetical protein
MIIISNFSSKGVRLKLGSEVKNKLKIRCVKAECPVCSQIGSIQLFLNKAGEVRYARTRHYSHLDKDSKKPQFTYCKVEDIQGLKTLISQYGISLTAEKGYGSIGQLKSGNIHDLELKDSSSVQQSRSGCSLAWFRTSACHVDDPGSNPGNRTTPLSD